MAWKIEYAGRAQKTLGKLDSETSARILAMLEDVSVLDDPRLRGHALTGQFTGLWRYRVGEWRVIARIEHARMVIVVIGVGNRREVYRA